MTLVVLEAQIPAWLGEALMRLESAELRKAVGGAEKSGHKYLRRVPSGDPRHPWRYFYNITGGQRLGHPEEMKQGARFRVKGGEHFEVASEAGDQVRIRHGKTGREADVPKQVLGTLLHREHAESITQVRRKLAKRMRAARNGTPEQKAQLAEEARAFLDHFAPGKPSVRAAAPGGTTAAAGPGAASKGAAPPARTGKGKAPKLPAEVKVEPGASFKIKAPAAIFGREIELTYHVAEVRDGKARITSRENGGGGQWMPTESVQHFVDDLHGVVRGPAGGPPLVRAVLDGKGELLGKGQDGIAFRVGGKVVKVSTTVPFQPDNPGHRSPRDAAAALERQGQIAGELTQAGVPGIMPVSTVRHGAKAFAIRDHVEVPAKWSQDQLDQVARTVETMHAKGWTLNDTVQAGIGADGKAYLFDVGAAEKRREGSAGKADIEQDAERLQRFITEAGGRYKPQTPEAVNVRWQAAILPSKVNAARFLKRGEQHQREITEARDAKIAAIRAEYGPEDPEIDIVREEADEAIAKLTAPEKPMKKSMMTAPEFPVMGAEALAELPDWLGAMLLELEDGELAKGVGHKYVRRIPTGNPKKPYRYFYDVTGGKGVGHHEEVAVGSKFAVRDAGKAGHFEVLHHDQTTVRVRHDETGAVHEMTKAALQAMLRREHAGKITAARGKAHQTLAAAQKHGTPAQQRKALERLRMLAPPEREQPRRAGVEAETPRGVHNPKEGTKEKWERMKRERAEGKTPGAIEKPAPKEGGAAKVRITFPKGAPAVDPDAARRRENLAKQGIGADGKKQAAGKHDAYLAEMWGERPKEGDSFRAEWDRVSAWLGKEAKTREEAEILFSTLDNVDEVLAGNIPGGPATEEKLAKVAALVKQRTARKAELDAMRSKPRADGAPPAIPREDLQGEYVAASKSGDLHKYGYQVIEWFSPKKAKAGQPASVIEYVPQDRPGEGIAAGKTRYTATTREEQIAVHKAIGAPPPVDNPPPKPKVDRYEQAQARREAKAGKTEKAPALKLEASTAEQERAHMEREAGKAKPKEEPKLEFGKKRTAADISDADTRTKLSLELEPTSGKQLGLLGVDAKRRAEGGASTTGQQTGLFWGKNAIKKSVGGGPMAYVTMAGEPVVIGPPRATEDTIAIAAKMTRQIRDATPRDGELLPALTIPVDVVEIPPWMGAILHAADEARLEKAVGHKYIRRVPTGNPKRPWRYFYAVTGGKTLGHQEEIKRGAKFKMADAGREGHFEVTAEDGDKITIKHDETGTSHEMTRAALAALLKEHHAEAIGKAREKIAADVKAARDSGTAKQQAKIEERGRQFQEVHGGLEDADKHRMVRPEDLRGKARAKAQEAAKQKAAEKPKEQPPEPKKTSGGFLTRPEVKESAKDKKTREDRERAGGKGSRKEHTEVGAHVYGSRADQAQLRMASDLDGMSNEDARKAVTKDKLAPQFNEEQFRATGGEPGAAHLIKFLLGTIASKPDDNDQSRRAYVDGIDLFTKTLENVTTTQGAMDVLKDLRQLAEGRIELGRFKTAQEARLVPGAVAHGYSWVEGTRDMEHVAWGIAPGTKERRTALQSLGPRLAKMLGLERRSGPSEAWHEAVREARKLDAAGWPTGKEEAAPKADKKAKVFRWEQEITGKPERLDGGPGVTKPDAKALAKEFGFHNVQFGNWVSDEDAQHHLVAAHNALRDLADVLGIEPEALTFNGDLAIGFGARGAGTARAHYEAGPKGKRIINLTKIAGGGTFAHEWGHYLDNMVAATYRASGDTSGRAPYVSDGGGSVHDEARMPKEVRNAFDAVMDAITGSNSRLIREHNETESRWREIAIEHGRGSAEAREARKIADAAATARNASSRKDTDYLRHARAMGGKSEDSYWTRRHELFARAWESFIQDKLEENERRNSYLVDGTRTRYMTGRPIQADRAAGSNSPKARAALEKLNAHIADLNKQVRARKAELLAQGAQPAEAQNAAIRELKPLYETHAQLKAAFEEAKNEREVLDPHAQPYPQGEERKRINEAMQGLLGALKGSGLLKAAAKDGPPVKTWAGPKPTASTKLAAVTQAAVEEAKPEQREKEATPADARAFLEATWRKQGRSEEEIKKLSTSRFGTAEEKQALVDRNKPPEPAKLELTEADLRRHAQSAHPKIRAAAEAELVRRGLSEPPPAGRKKEGDWTTKPQPKPEEKPKITITPPAGGSDKYPKPAGHAEAVAAVKAAGAKVGFRGDHGLILEKVPKALEAKLKAAGAIQGRTTWTLPPAAVTKFAQA